MQEEQCVSLGLGTGLGSALFVDDVVVPMELAFRADFHQLPNKQTQWKAFLGKSALNANSSLAETIRVIREFVMPVVEGMSKGDLDKKP